MLSQGIPSSRARLEAVRWHRGEERSQALPFNATALLAENAGFGGKIVMRQSTCNDMHRWQTSPLTPLTHPTTPSPVRAALGCCVQRNRQKKPPLPASHLLAHSADGAPGAAPVQVEHHLHRPCALRLGYIVPPTRPPAS